MKNNRKRLEKLHEAITDYYIEILEDGEELSSGTLNAINSFLKNNNVVLDEVDSSPVQNLHLMLNNLIEEPAQLTQVVKEDDDSLELEILEKINAGDK